jgi:hypothetical protein
LFYFLNGWSIKDDFGRHDNHPRFAYQVASRSFPAVQEPYTQNDRFVRFKLAKSFGNNPNPRSLFIAERDLSIINRLPCICVSRVNAILHCSSSVVHVLLHPVSAIREISRRPSYLVCRASLLFSGGNDSGRIGLAVPYLGEGVAHNFQLPVINAQSDNADESKNAVHYKLSALNPPKLPRKLLGGFLLVCGSIIGIWANFALGWRGWNHWRLSRRLTLGIGGWSIAVVLVRHGTALLLGIN